MLNQPVYKLYYESMDQATDKPTDQPTDQPMNKPMTYIVACMRLKHVTNTEIKKDALFKVNLETIPLVGKWMLKPGAKRPAWLTLRSAWLALRPDWLALRPAWLGLRPAWLALGPSRGGMDGRMDGRTYGWTDGKSPRSTGLHPLLGPLPRCSPTSTQKLYNAGQGYHWPYDASWRLVIIVGYSLIPHPSLFGCWFTGNRASK